MSGISKTTQFLYPGAASAAYITQPLKVVMWGFAMLPDKTYLLRLQKSSRVYLCHEPSAFWTAGLIPHSSFTNYDRKLLHRLFSIERFNLHDEQLTGHQLSTFGRQVPLLA